MNDKLKVKNEPIYRDTQNNALIFTNKLEIEEYETKKQKKKQKEDALKIEINTIKQDVNELKQMIELILNKLKN